ncbi:M56 family metallopeptidase [Myxococcus stipitatus]|uniref:M56 family metallopeptidase n=1 Tax=Myxococcus stipitatus TaxID=83455 RepID=UPI001F22E4DA|nr:M56 family metallopeptidase [Myxococcus stipitatus]MCE9669763.1 M56 family metallopeptidase [Myxococcus stipitatus]
MDTLEGIMEGLGRGVSAWLAHGIWQATVVALVAGALLWLLRRRSARVRYVVGCVSLGALVLAPSATLLAAVSEVAPAPGSASRAPDAWLALAGEGRGFAPEAEPLSSSSGVEAAAAAGVDAWLPLGLAALWLLGAGMGLLRLYRGWRGAQARLVKPALPAPTSLVERVEAVSRRLGLRRPVRVVESALAPSPLVLGVWRPLLVLPRGMAERLTPAQQESVFAHELSHVRRHDASANLAQSLVDVLFFFHPAARWLSRQVRLEREHCCDDVAVGLCGSAQVYSGALLGLEELRQEGLALGAGTAPLLARVRRLLGLAPQAEPVKGARRLTRLGGGLAVLLASGAAWAWEGPVASRGGAEARGALVGAASCTRSVYPKDFTALTAFELRGRTVRSRIFVSRCGRVRLEAVEGPRMPVLLYDAGSLERVVLDRTERTYEVLPAKEDFGLPLHLPGGCTEKRAGCEKVGERVVAGRRTEGWRRSHAPHDTVTQWVDAELGYAVREESDLFGSITLSDIREGPQDAALFLVPAGFHDAATAAPGATADAAP